MKHIKLHEKTDIAKIQSALDNKFKYETSSYGLRMLDVKSGSIDVCLSKDGLNIFILDRLPVWLDIGIGAIMMYSFYSLASLNKVGSDYYKLLMPIIMVVGIWFIVNTLVKKVVFSQYISNLSDALGLLSAKAQ